MPIISGYGSYIVGDIFNGHDIQIIIGKFCSIAHNLEIFGGEHAPIPHPECVSSWPFEHFMHIPYPTSVVGTSVVIGNDVWIGQNVALKQDIVIGDGAIIGAYSVVTKSVKPYEIVGGNPARHIRFRFTPEQINRLLEIKWWDWSIEKIKANIGLLWDIEKLLSSDVVK